MTLARRVAAVETALSPTELVRRWLDEAHAFGDLEASVRSLLDGAADDLPIDRLAREATEGARAQMKGKGRDLVDGAVRTALRETMFRFELVMRINVSAHELLSRESLIEGLLAAQLAMLAREEHQGAARDPTSLARLRSCRDIAASRLIELLAAGQARATCEARYLDGHPALFPDAVTAWAEQLRQAEGLTDVATRLAELDSADIGKPPARSAIAARASVLAADLIEPARSTALEKLGEGARAFAIATRWLRSKAGPGIPSEGADTGTPTPTL